MELSRFVRSVTSRLNSIDADNPALGLYKLYKNLSGSIDYNKMTLTAPNGVEFDGLLEVYNYLFQYPEYEYVYDAELLKKKITVLTEYNAATIAALLIAFDVNLNKVATDYKINFTADVLTGYFTIIGGNVKITYTLKRFNDSEYRCENALINIDDDEYYISEESEIAIKVMDSPDNNDTRMFKNIKAIADILNLGEIKRCTLGYYRFNPNNNRYVYEGLDSFKKELDADEIKRMMYLVGYQPDRRIRFLTANYGVFVDKSGKEYEYNYNKYIKKWTYTID